MCLIVMLVFGSGRAVGQGGDPEKLVGGMEKKLAKAKTLTDSAEEAVQLVQDAALRQFRLSYGPRIKPRWYLWE